MKQPINVTTDRSINAAYVEYAPESSVSTVNLTETGSVAYDVDVDGNVVGIEVLGIQHPDRVEIAREFAASRELDFPRDLTSVPA
jgi:uncharacterized protein YuzE